MSAMVTRLATVAALAVHAVHATREKMAGSELSSSEPWKARESSASGSSASSKPSTPRRAAREHTCFIVSSTIASPRVQSR
eukprot:2929883-Prymnesium_polylepis.1